MDEQAVPALREMVSRFGAALGQETMYFELGSAEVEFLSPPEKEADS